MVNLIFNLVVIFAVIACVFFATRKLVMMWTGSTREEATRKIQAFVSQTEVYHLATDQMLIEEIWKAVCDIIGDTRYEELCRLSRTSKLFETNFASGLPYILVTVDFADENEKIRLENILTNLVSKYLCIHGLSKDVLADWKENRHVKMPALMIRYTETEEQLQILNVCLQEETVKIIKKHQPLTDDEI
ncbi:MAG: hypothetical protein PHY47_27675 [Lachnospiraceae bacterium]|nr:hypothetical protein [Lachnospiraceae bacterium]